MVRITPIYKPWKGHLEGGQPYLGGLLTMVINHLLTGMILQVLPTPRIPSKKWDLVGGSLRTWGSWGPTCLEDHPRTDVSGDRITPMYFSHEKAMNGRGPTTRSLGDLRSRCLLTYSAKGPFRGTKNNLWLQGKLGYNNNPTGSQGLDGCQAKWPRFKQLLMNSTTETTPSFRFQKHSENSLEPLASRRK